MTFNTYPKIRQLLWLMFALVAENFGYRQLNSVWRMIGLYKWLFKYKSIWGEMLRTASWTGKILSETVAIDSEKHEAVPHSLQSNAAGIPLLREKYNLLSKTESRWGKSVDKSSRADKTSE